MQLPNELFEEVRLGLGAEVRQVLGTANALAAFRSSGSTSPAQVERQLRRWRRALELPREPPGSRCSTAPQGS
jgi:argininosuccinate lyase